MSPDDFARTIGELHGHVSRILGAIENGGGGVNLRDLGLRLMDIVVIIERDPGILAAAADLYAAAEVMVRDSAARLQPEARKRRLLRDARQRFDQRFEGARPAARERTAEAAQRDLRIAA